MAPLPRLIFPSHKPVVPTPPQQQQQKKKKKEKKKVLKMSSQSTNKCE
jgi:hypothetical protein